ncbi:MFS transporter [Rhodoferax koreense]|uniref:MFS transporter n=1 Tax=Rhodoferax koreensis TaxID=1842727 RepID=A0A1P8JRT3_9BURK|nr:MFS transporter [Rhodoferax koreense]APW36477.1 MFS transporter [Rhodoferax koreense]
MPATQTLPAFRGWTMVAATHVLFALIFGATYAYGAFFEALQQTFQADRFSVSAVFSGTAFVYYLMGLVSGALADRFSARRIVGAGIALLSLGLALASLATSLPALMALFCAFVGLGVGLVYIPAITVVQRWFVRQRSRASGLALAGTGLGTLVGPVLAGALLQHYDWRATLQWFALGVAVLGLGAASQLLGQPADAGQRPDGDALDAPAAAQVAAVGLTRPQALRSARFWWYFASIFLASIGLFVAMVHISPQARALGVAPAQSPVLIGLIGVGNVLGRLLLGGLGDRLGPRRLLFWLTVALALSSLLWFCAAGFWGLALFALLFGAANGGCIALYPAVAAGWFGTRHLGAVLGALYVGVGIAALLGASAAGWLLDFTQSYTAPILGSGGAALLAAACLAVAARQGTQAKALNPRPA